MDPTRLSLTALTEQIRSGAVRAVDAVDAYLARIDAHNETLNAYITVDHDGARSAAAAIDARIRSGEDPGPLAGAPVAVKDIFCTKGLRTTCASRILDRFVPPYDATAVARLREAGAVVLGKTNLDEFAMGSSNENSAFGPVRNPFGLDRVAGGSSGGSAVAATARLAAAAIGTDTGGSIRQPASLSGCVGVKPTYGRISRYGMIAFASSLDQCGPLTRSVADAARLTQVMAGADPRDSTCVEVPVPDFVAAASAGSGVDGLRVGVPREYFAEGLDPEVAACVRAALDRFENAGAHVEEVSLPHSRYAVATYYLVATAEASSNLARYDGVRYGHRAADADNLLDQYMRTRAEGFGPEVKRRIMLGTYALSAGYYDAYYRKAMQVRTLIRQDFEAVFDAHDVIVGPVSPTPAWELGEKVDDPLAMYLSDIYTISVNLAGLPGLSVPCGSTAGLPIGLQLIAPAFEEARLFSAAAWVEQNVATELAEPEL